LPAYRCTDAGICQPCSVTFSPIAQPILSQSVAGHPTQTINHAAAPTSFAHEPKALFCTAFILPLQSPRELEGPFEHWSPAAPQEKQSHSYPMLAMPLYR
jgi:hypothetical protein